MTIELDQPAPVPHRSARRLSTLLMTREAITVGLDFRGGMMERIKGHDIARFRMGTRRFVSLTNPDYVDHVLYAGRLRYHKSLEYETIRGLMGVSLFTDEGESWQAHRTTLNPMFARRHLNGLIDLMIEPIESAIQQIDARPGPLRVAMVDEMVQLTLDVVGNALFGRRFGDVARDMAGMVTEGLRFGEALLRLLLVAGPPRFAVRAALRLAFLPVVLPPPFYGIQRIAKTLDKAVWELVRDRHENPTDSPDLLNHLFRAAEDSGGLSLRRIRNETMTLMLAGHETTANALSWTWYLLALHPQARDRMLAEVDTVLRGRRPSVEDVGKLPWTAACFQESMRYFSPAWLIPRVAVEDDSIDGHRIRKGTSVLIPAHLIHHDERWWPNPEEFDPSRFLPGASKDRPRSTYLPFGGGKRICIGSSFALMESVLILAMMSQRFVFDLEPGHPVEPETTLTLRPRHGISMIARRREALA